MHWKTICIAMAAALPWDRADGQAPVTGGVLAGITSATIVDESDLARSRLTRSLFGAYVTKPLNARLRLRGEVLVAGMGVKLHGEFESTTVTTRLEVGYLEVPVLLEVGRSGRGRVAPVVFAGVAPAWRLSCRQATDVGNATLSGDCNEMSAALRRFDLAAVVGGGVTFPLLGRRGRAEVRYRHGLRSLSADAVARNRAWSVVVGFDVLGQR